MNISVRAQGFSVTEAIDAFVNAEVRSAVKRFEDDIVSADVFMKDTNGPKGGIDKQVLLRIQLRNRQQLTLCTTREDLYAAVKVTARRAKRAVRRSVTKARDVRKPSLRRIASNPRLGEAPGI